MRRLGEILLVIGLSPLMILAIALLPAMFIDFMHEDGFWPTLITFSMTAFIVIGGFLCVAGDE